MTTDNRSAPDGDDGFAALSGLLRRSALGDEAAFAELYLICSPRLYGLALSVLGEPDQAAQVTQEAFLAIWRNSARFDPVRGSAIGWMVSIAHRYAVDRARRDNDSLRRDDASALGPFESTALGSPVQAPHGFKAAWVRAAVDGLTATQRSAILLAYFGGRTHTEIAASLGLPLGTAPARIRDGLRALR